MFETSNLAEDVGSDPVLEVNVGFPAWLLDTNEGAKLEAELMLDTDNDVVTPV